MIGGSASALLLSSREVPPVPLRIAGSAVARGAPDTWPTDFFRWFADARDAARARVERLDLDDLDGWTSDPVTGNLRHHSGGFFSIEGLRVRLPGGPVRDWSQPIINQPEIGVLGILAKEFDGVLHFLMQAKIEPGNCNGLQLSPTVQATRSNYTRLHRGRIVPYLEYFRDTSAHRVIADVRQSEQGSAFHRKRNRNMVVEITEDVETLDGFRWLSLGQVQRLLAVDDVVNMDARTVLSCLPLAHPDLGSVLDDSGEGFRPALVRSCLPQSAALHSMDGILSWITDARSRIDIHTERVPLSGLPGWRRRDGRITHNTGRFFDVIGVRFEAAGREVRGWTQPMVQPHGIGVVAFLTRSIGGVLHVLAHTRVEAGLVDVVELAPTVQCTPENYEGLPAEARPRFLDETLGAAPERIRFEAVLSEEGGRFYHARNRYLVVEAPGGLEPEGSDYRWMTLRQFTELLRHSHYLNIQARSLVACLHSLSADTFPVM